MRVFQSKLGYHRLKSFKTNYPKDCYLGCFQDQFVRDLNDDGMASRTMTIDRCRKFCSKYTYAALQNGYFLIFSVCNLNGIKFANKNALTKGPIKKTKKAPINTK